MNATAVSRMVSRLNGVAQVSITLGNNNIIDPNAQIHVHTPVELVLIMLCIGTTIAPSN